MTSYFPLNPFFKMYYNIQPPLLVIFLLISTSAVAFMSSEAYFLHWHLDNMTKIGFYYCAQSLDIPGVSVTISANLGKGKKKDSSEFCPPTNNNNLITIVRLIKEPILFTFSEAS